MHHPGTLAVGSALVEAHVRQDRVTRACAVCSDLWKGIEAQRGSGSDEAAAMLSRLGRLQARVGEYEAAETSLRAAWEQQRGSPALGPKHYVTLTTQFHLGSALVDASDAERKRPADADAGAGAGTGAAPRRSTSFAGPDPGLFKDKSTAETTRAMLVGVFKGFKLLYGIDHPKTEAVVLTLKRVDGLATSTHADSPSHGHRSPKRGHGHGHGHRSPKYGHREGHGHRDAPNGR